MIIPSYVISIHMVLYGLRNLPALPRDIRHFIIDLFEKTLDKPIISAYCNFPISSGDKIHHVFINFEDEENSTSYVIAKKLKEPNYSPVFWFKDGYRSTYFSFSSNCDFDLFLNLLWECGITHNKLKTIHFSQDVLKSNIL